MSKTPITDALCLPDYDLADAHDIIRQCREFELALRAAENERDAARQRHEDASQNAHMHYTLAGEWKRRYESLREEAAANAPWLTLAHCLCTDAGVPHGYIYDRMQQLGETFRELKAKSQS